MAGQDASRRPACMKRTRRFDSSQPALGVESLAMGPTTLITLACHSLPPVRLLSLLPSGPTNWFSRCLMAASRPNHNTAPRVSPVTAKNTSTKITICMFREPPPAPDVENPPHRKNPEGHQPHRPYPHPDDP